MRSKPLDSNCAACFEEQAGVFAGSGALHYAKILASLKMKNGISLTPLNCALNAFTLALNDSADAFLDLAERRAHIVERTGRSKSTDVIATSEICHKRFP